MNGIRSLINRRGTDLSFSRDAIGAYNAITGTNSVTTSTFTARVLLFNFGNGNDDGIVKDTVSGYCYYPLAIHDITTINGKAMRISNAPKTMELGLYRVEFSA